MKVLVIIPAKTDSTRLPRKNLQLINGKTLIEYSIEYAKNSKYRPTIVVSSESELVKDIAISSNVYFRYRDESLLKDAEVTDVYLDVCNNIDHIYDYVCSNMDPIFDYVVGLQPDHPDREHSFDYCLEYMISNNYDDLITIEPNFKRSGSVRIFKYRHLVDGHISKRIGCIKDDATDIHYEEDLERARNRIINGNS